MVEKKYANYESLNRILRAFTGESVPSDDPGVLPGEILSIDDALSQFAELLFDSLPNQSLVLPTSVRNAMGNAGFYRGWGGGDNYFVDPNHVNASDLNTGKDANKPLATIQRGITNMAAMHGDNLWVLQNDGWTYGSGTGETITEAVVVPATKPGIHILGAGYGSMGVNWTAGVTGTFCLTINAMDVVVDGFNFWGSPVDCHGILCDWAAPATFGENTVIRNCTFSSGMDVGIQLEYAWYNEIENCKFHECDDYGIFVDPAGSGISYNKITGNYFNDCAYAMALDDAEHCLIEGNNIYNTEAQATGTATNMGLNTAAGGYNTVNNNTFSCLLANWDTFNSAAATDAWVNNHVIDGNPTTRPA
jgi:parallel beta-helix repeat protein